MTSSRKKYAFPVIGSIHRFVFGYVCVPVQLTETCTAGTKIWKAYYESWFQLLIFWECAKWENLDWLENLSGEVISGCFGKH